MSGPAAMQATTPELSFGHLVSLTTPLGLFEHALGDHPRPEHGYCLDDVARGLVVTARQPDTTRQGSHDPAALARVYLAFTLAAQDRRGRFRNRRRTGGSWVGAATVEDHWGRALWGLGTVASSDLPSADRAVALHAATLGLRARSPWPRAMAYASLGAFELLRAHPGHRVARALLADAGAMLGRPGADPSWPWPEPRLTYANAVLPEALLAVGSALDDPRAVDDGLQLLTWLVGQETRDGRLSVTPAGGIGPEGARPAFDQQPIEVSALAEACWRAYAVTADEAWLTPIRQAVAWFGGDNDSGLRLVDPVTGAGSDGLHADRVNANRGAESTLAALATFQRGRLADAASR